MVVLSYDKKKESAKFSELRREAGAWLKLKRLDRGLSQSQLAAKLGSDHYTFISQIEIGKSRIPPERYLDWARALDIPEREFIRHMLRFYDPAIHAVMFREERKSRRSPPRRTPKVEEVSAFSARP